MSPFWNIRGNGLDAQPDDRIQSPLGRSSVWKIHLRRQPVENAVSKKHEDYSKGGVCEVQCDDSPFPFETSC
jgi:hypothetical protein